MIYTLCFVLGPVQEDLDTPDSPEKPLILDTPDSPTDTPMSPTTDTPASPPPQADTPASPTPMDDTPASPETEKIQSKPPSADSREAKLIPLERQFLKKTAEFDIRSPKDWHRGLRTTSTLASASPSSECSDDSDRGQKRLQIVESPASSSPASPASGGDVCINKPPPVLPCPIPSSGPGSRPSPGQSPGLGGSRPSPGQSPGLGGSRPSPGQSPGPVLPRPGPVPISRQGSMQSTGSSSPGGPNSGSNTKPLPSSGSRHGFRLGQDQRGPNIDPNLRDSPILSTSLPQPRPSGPVESLKGFEPTRSSSPQSRDGSPGMSPGMSPKIDPSSGPTVRRDPRSGPVNRDPRSGSASRDPRAGSAGRDPRAGSRDPRSGPVSRDPRDRPGLLPRPASQDQSMQNELAKNDRDPRLQAQMTRPSGNRTNILLNVKKFYRNFGLAIKLS